MAGRKKPGWQQFLLDGDCDVWLLTEVNEDIVLPGFELHLGTASMALRRRWAGVYSRRPATPLPDPHPASAAVVIDGVTYCSTVLPWTASGGEPNWPGGDGPEGKHAGRTAHALQVLRASLPSSGLVWGGDWNHALDGPEGAGSMGGRRHLAAMLAELDLKVPTTWLPHRLGTLSIDHLAVPVAWPVTAARHRRSDGLSDHDSYVIDVVPRD